DLLVVVAASGVLFGLVVARMAGLVRQQERYMARERTLGGAGVALVAATTREEIYDAAVESARALLEVPAAVRVHPVDEGEPVAGAGLVLELSAQGRACGWLVIAGDVAPSRSVRSALQTLATQVSLALDSAALMEEVHRRAGEARFRSLVQHS